MIWDSGFHSNLLVPKKLLESAISSPSSQKEYALPGINFSACSPKISTLLSFKSILFLICLSDLRAVFYHFFSKALKLPLWAAQAQFQCSHLLFRAISNTNRVKIFL